MLAHSATSRSGAAEATVTQEQRLGGSLLLDDPFMATLASMTSGVTVVTALALQHFGRGMRPTRGQRAKLRRQPIEIGVNFGL